jgi:hypothetical protein
MLFHLLCRWAIYFASVNLYLNVCLFGRTGRRCALRPPPIANSLATDASAEPIRVDKRVCGKKRQNRFYDDRGFSDQSHKFDVLLRTIDGGTIVQKRKHPAPPLDDIDPCFFVAYDEAKHGATLQQLMDLSHLPPRVQQQIYRLLQKYWSVFDNKGQFVPVKDYQCVIDTGSARPISVKKIHYGPRETPIMRRCIAALAKVGHIRQINDGEWLFKALLAPKPHQEHVSNIADFVW